MKRIIFIMCGLLALASVQAAQKSKKTSSSKKKAEVAKVDTVDNATFSYAFGIANSRGLKQHLAMRMGVDTTKMDAFLKGYDGGLESGEFLSALKAYVAGAEIRQQTSRDLVRRIDADMTGNDSTQLLDRALFAQGFRDALIGQETMSMDSAITAIEKNTKYYSEKVLEEKYGDWRRQNVAWLDANAKKDSVQQTESGLQYKVLVMGEGEKPQATDKVKVNYEGRLIDGTVFDSSYKRKQAATFGCSQVIKGWTEALLMMPVGSKWELYIPQDLAYGEREQGKIKPFSALVFTVELLSVER